jgi:hypothetical protein
LQFVWLDLGIELRHAPAQFGGGQHRLVASRGHAFLLLWLPGRLPVGRLLLPG